MEEDTVFLEDEAKCLVERERCRVDVPGNRRTRVSVEWKEAFPIVEEKPLPPVGQVLMLLNRKVANEQVADVSGWIHLLCEWERGHGARHLWRNSRGQISSGKAKEQRKLEMWTLSNRKRKQNRKSRGARHCFDAVFLRESWGRRQRG